MINNKFIIHFKKLIVLYKILFIYKDKKIKYFKKLNFFKSQIIEFSNIKIFIDNNYIELIFENIIIIL